MTKNCFKCELRRVCIVRRQTFDTLTAAGFIDFDKTGDEWLYKIYKCIASRCIEFKPQAQETPPETKNGSIDTPHFCSKYYDKKEPVKCDTQCAKCLEIQNDLNERS